MNTRVFYIFKYKMYEAYERQVKYKKHCFNGIADISGSKTSGKKKKRENDNQAKRISERYDMTCSY